MEHSAFERLAPEKRAAIVEAGIAEFSAHSYTDASTDRITAACGISKGLLFHYFGKKKDFYIYCAQYALGLLTDYGRSEPEGDFYDILFAEMEQKMSFCAKHPKEMRFVNLVFRENSADVAEEKNKLLAAYSPQMQLRSRSTLTAAMSKLRLKVPTAEATESMLLYTGAVMNQYMAQYQNEPEAFFGRQDELKIEIKRRLDQMLYGICEESEK